MKNTQQRPIPESLEEPSLSSNYDRVFSGESLRGLDSATTQLDQTRTEVFNRLRELGNELGRRRGAQSSPSESQSHVALSLVNQLAGGLTEVIESANGNDWKLAEAQRLFATFHKKLAKVLELISSLKAEDYIDVEAEVVDE